MEFLNRILGKGFKIFKISVTKDKLFIALEGFQGEEDLVNESINEKRKPVKHERFPQT